MQDYKVLRPVGKGSFGKVYLAQNIVDKKNYCLKVIKLKGIPPKEREACRNEVMLMQRLQHPNIVAYKDSFFANGRDNLCIVMTFADGGDLGQRISDAKSHLFKEDQIMHWFVQAALAIHYMHENKVLHRDIKAQNIFMLGNGRLVLGDLGISKVLDGTVQFAQTQIGTPYYMSPELFKNKPYNHKSDVWALGCVLYELCTLVHPFDAGNIQGLAQKIMKGSYAPISAKYSTSLRNLVSSMLAVNVNSRPSVAEVLQQPYLKKHIYNFVKDIAERSNQGVGAAVFANEVHGQAGLQPVSEGTMIFRAAAMKAANVGGGDALTAAVAAGLGPHANNLNQQLIGLGLQSTVKQALQDAVVSVSTPAAGLKPAFSLQNLVKEKESAPVVAAPVVVAPSVPQQKVSSSDSNDKVILGPDGRPLSPTRARKYLKEQQAALEREEERKRAVEAALERLRKEKELRAKMQVDAKRLAERRASSAVGSDRESRAVGSAPSSNLAVGGGHGAALLRNLLPPSSGGGGGIGIAAVGAAKVNVVPLASAPSSSGAGSNSSVAAVQAAAARQQADRAAAIQQARVAVGMVAPVGLGGGAAPGSSVASGGGAGGKVPVRVSSSSSSSSSSNNPPNAGAGAARLLAVLPSALDRPGSKPSSAGSHGSAAEAKVQALQLKKESASADAARKAKVDDAIAKMVPQSGGISAAAKDERKSGAAAVADLDAWEREKGLVAAGVRVRGERPGIAALQAISGQAVASSGGASSKPSSRDSSLERQPSSNDRPSGASAVSMNAGGGGGKGIASKPSPAAAASSAASVSSAPSVSGSAVQTKSSRAPSSERPLPTSTSSSSSAVVAKAAPIQLQQQSQPSSLISSKLSGDNSSRPPSGASSVTISAQSSVVLPEDDGVSARERVLQRKEEKRKAEEEAERERLRAAALESYQERARAAYLTREQFSGVGAAKAGALPIAQPVLDNSLEQSRQLSKALSLPGSRFSSSEGKSDDTIDTQKEKVTNVDVEEEEEEENGGIYANGELPFDANDDSEDEVILESAVDDYEDEDNNNNNNNDQHSNPVLPSAESSNSSQGRKSASSSSNSSSDILDVETQLRQELQRSTMRCADLRKSLDVARIVAVKAGVQLNQVGSAVKQRRTSDASTLVNTPNRSSIGSYAGGGGGGGFSLPPSAFDKEVDARIVAHNGRPTINTYIPADERPIRPAAAYGGSPVDGGEPSPLATATGQAQALAPSVVGRNLPPPSSASSHDQRAVEAAAARAPLPPAGRPVLAPSAAATAAAGGYIKTSHQSSHAVAEPPVIPGVRTYQHSSQPGAIPTSSSTTSYDSPALSDENLATEDEDDENKENENDDDEEDIGDEDGDEDGQVVFSRPAPSSGGRKKLHDGTIREEDEGEGDEEEEEEEEYEDEESSSTFGSGGFASEFKTHLLGMPSGETTLTSGYMQTQSLSGGGGGGGGSGRGSLSSRVEELRKMCLAGLGQEAFESVYTAVKEAVWEEQDEDDDTGSSTVGATGAADEAIAPSFSFATTDVLSKVASKLNLTPQQSEFVDVVQTLVHIEQDLL